MIEEGEERGRTHKMQFILIFVSVREHKGGQRTIDVLCILLFETFFFRVLLFSFYYFFSFFLFSNSWIIIEIFSFFLVIYYLIFLLFCSFSVCSWGFLLQLLRQKNERGHYAAVDFFYDSFWSFSLLLLVSSAQLKLDFMVFWFRRFLRRGLALIARIFAGLWSTCLIFIRRLQRFKGSWILF